MQYTISFCNNFVQTGIKTGFYDYPGKDGEKSLMISLSLEEYGDELTEIGSYNDLGLVCATHDFFCNIGRFITKNNIGMTVLKPNPAGDKRTYFRLSPEFLKAEFSKEELIRYFNSFGKRDKIVTEADLNFMLTVYELTYEMEKGIIEGIRRYGESYLVSPYILAGIEYNKK